MAKLSNHEYAILEIGLVLPVEFRINTGNWDICWNSLGCIAVQNANGGASASGATT